MLGAQFAPGTLGLAKRIIDTEFGRIIVIVKTHKSISSNCLCTPDRRPYSRHRKAGGAVNRSRGILCAWKKDEKIAAARDEGKLTMEDIVEAAVRASVYSKKDLLSAKKSL